MSTTTYGTIPTSTPPPPGLTGTRPGVGTRRPWKEMIPLSLPESFKATIRRIQTNASYFHVNYTIIVLFTLFISLLWHPVSLGVFVVVMAAWLFLYFLRDDPIVVFGYDVEEHVVLVVLSIFTVALLLMTHAVVFLAGMAVGMVVVVAHGAVRGTSDLCFDVEGGERVVDLKETVSVSYSSSSNLIIGN